MEEHIDDRCCSDCYKYSCNYIITNGKKGHSCPCSCHKKNVPKINLNVRKR